MLPCLTEVHHMVFLSNANKICSTPKIEYTHHFQKMVHSTVCWLMQLFANLKQLFSRQTEWNSSIYPKALFQQEHQNLFLPCLLLCKTNCPVCCNTISCARERPPMSTLHQQSLLCAESEKNSQGSDSSTEKIWELTCSFNTLARLSEMTKGQDKTNRMRKPKEEQTIVVFLKLPQARLSCFSDSSCFLYSIAKDIFFVVCASYLTCIFNPM